MEDIQISHLALHSLLNQLIAAGEKNLRLYKHRQIYQLQDQSTTGQEVLLLSGLLTMEEMYHFLCGRLSIIEK